MSTEYTLSSIAEELMPLVQQKAVWPQIATLMMLVDQEKLWREKEECSSFSAWVASFATDVYFALRSPPARRNRSTVTAK